MALQGIDVSNWQGDIALDRVPADFVIIKATEGTWLVDKRCDRNYQLAKKAGRLLGVYHYAEGGDPIEEAKYFLKAIKGYIGHAIMVLDWESGSNVSFGKNDKKWVKTFCDYVAKETGIKPMVYISASARHKIDGIGDYGLWIAQYPDYERTGYQAHPWNEGAYDCAMRQYTSSGELPGYEDRLDLNKFYGDEAAWKKYAGIKEEDKGKNGWVESTSWQYYENDKLVYGWKEIKDKWYYFDEKGNAVAGWQNIEDKKYYFHLTGYNMMKEWQKIDGKWYYFHKTGGNLMYGWQKIDEKWYYFDPEDGHMFTEWAEIDGKKYYFHKEGGNMMTGWQKISDKWYYFHLQGGNAMRGWQKINNRSYYFYDDYHMAADETTPDGYRVDKNGVWQK